MLTLISIFSGGLISSISKHNWLEAPRRGEEVKMLKIWSMKQQQQKNEAAAGGAKKKKVTAAQLRVQKGRPP